MKKKEIDELNNTSEEKPNMEKRREKGMKKGSIFIWVAIFLVCICLIVGGIFLFNNKGKQGLTNNSISNTPSQKEVVIESYPLLSELKMKSNGIEDFDFYFLKLNNDGKNVVYSPLSIKYALEMLSEGAKGETKEQIDAILGEYEANKYTNSKNMSFANAFFVNNSIKESINKEYIDNLKLKFDAPTMYDSFDSAETINNWISDKTLGLINDLLTDPDVQDKFFALVNALAIDMEWVNTIQPTDKDSTSEMDFGYSVDFPNEDAYLYISYRDAGESMHFNNGKELDVSAMYFGSIFNNYDIIKELGEDNIRKTVTDAYNEWLEEDDNKDYGYDDFDGWLNKYIEDLKTNYHKSGNSTDYKYYIGNNVKVFSKDLKKYNGKQLEYIQIMPTKGTLEDYIKNLSASKLKELIGKLKTPNYKNYKEGVVTKINGSMPAFKYEYNLNLIENLNKLGIHDVFDLKKADLSGMISGPAFIDSAKHKALIELSNDGIKAAAVTFIGGAGADDIEFNYTFKVPVEEIDLSFNKPFIYVIRDKKTSEVWFAGSVYTPTLIEDVDLGEYEY